MMKKIIALILAISTLFSALSVCAGSLLEQNLSSVNFPDMKALPKDHWSKPAVYLSSALGILKGYPEGFMPTGTATRSEALAVIMRAANLEKTASLAYQNMKDKKSQTPYLYNNTDEWADGYLRLAIDYKIIDIPTYNNVMSYDYPYNPQKRTFIKEQPVTRMEVTEWFVKIFKLPLSEKPDLITDYDDYKEIDQTKAMYVETALKYGIINGYGSSLSLNGTISRQELAQMLFNIRHLALQKLGIEISEQTVKSIVTDTLSATETEVKTSTTFVLSDDTSYTAQRTYKLNGVAVDYTSFAQNDTDILTIKQGFEPSGVSILEENDKIEIYKDKDGKILFILSLSSSSSAQKEILDESFKEASPVFGSLYLVDEKNGTLIIKLKDDMAEIPYLSGLTAFEKNSEIDFFKDTTKYLDYNCVVFCATKNQGTIPRAYRIQLLDL